MIVHHDISQFNVKYPVVTIGIFDGVHLGHKYILEQLKKEAGSSRGESVIITLWPHPRLVLNKEQKNFYLLTTQSEKTRILESSGIDHLVILPFSAELSRMSSCDFIEKILVGEIGIGKLVVGYNHRFGRDREGSYRQLKECAEKFKFGIEKLDAFHIDQRKISSSEIRKLLHTGNVEEANKLLGWTYGFSGNVTGGSQLGSSIGFPTANILMDEPLKLLPADGVYAVEAEMKNKTYRGMMNKGSRPTVNKDPQKKTLEVHLLDFRENIYSEEIRIRFIARIRDEQRFDNVETLKAQLGRDRERVIRVFKGD
jgi:riboflavin kinase/FMN adenylyltransferase